MSLPVSWVVAGAIPASQALKQTASLASTSASHFFGELLQTSPTPSNTRLADNGRSGQTEATPKSKSNSDTNSVADRVESLRSYLSKFVRETRSRYGLPPAATKLDGISISANGSDKPVLKGPEPMRTELENFLHENPSLRKEIDAIALQKSNLGPLHLLPPAIAQGSTNEPWTLWLGPE